MATLSWKLLRCTSLRTSLRRVVPTFNRTVRYSTVTNAPVKSGRDVLPTSTQGAERSDQDVQRHRTDKSVRTADPARLTADDFVDASDMTLCRINFVASSTHRQAFSIAYGSDMPFPPNTRGFLHYHTPAGMPPAAGEVRFRVTHGADPKYFHTGSDLLGPDGLPWSLPLTMLAHGLNRHTKGIPFRRELLVKSLVHDGLVDAAVLDGLAVLVAASGWVSTRKPPKSIVHSLDQLVHVQLENTSVSVMFVGERQVSPTRIEAPFAHYTGPGRSRVVPFSGEALCRFEKSPVPLSDGTDTLVLRVVKLVTPVTCAEGYDGYLAVPKEGELVQIHSQKGRAQIGRASKLWRLSAKLAKDEAIQDLIKSSCLPSTIVH